MKSILGFALIALLAANDTCVAQKLSDPAIPFAGPLSGTELLSLSQGGGTKKITTGTLATLIPPFNSLALNLTGFPVATHGLSIDVTTTLIGSYLLGPTTANFLHTINTGVIGGNNFTSTLLVEHEFGGSSVTGGQNSLEVDGYFDKGATSATNPNRNYVGGFFQMVAFNGDGGTDPTMAATSKGGIFGMNPFGDAKVGIAFANVSGGEVNVALETGTSAFEKTGLQIVDHALDQVSGSYIDAGLAIGAQIGAIGFQNGILFSNGNGGSPIKPTGCLICTTANAVPVVTGIDISPYNISGFAWKSAGASITGAGAISGIVQFLTGANPGPSYQPSQTAGSFISSNFTGGSREVDFFNMVNNAAGFNFYQKTGATTGALLATINGGTIILPGMATSTPCGTAPAGTLWNSGGTVHVC
jgi:hypothetical protein